MAKRTVKTPEKVEGGGGGADKIKVPGWYHVHVTTCLADITNNDKPINGIFAEFAAFDGQPEAGKTCQSSFFDPDPAKAYDPNSGASYDDWKDGDGKGWLMAEKKQLAFLVATGLINESQFGKELEYDTDDGINRQLVLEMAVDDRNKDKGYMQINYANTYHIDDPRVADLVKAKKLTLNQDAIKLLPANLRRDPKSFDLEKLGGKKAGGNGNGHAGGGSVATSSPSPGGGKPSNAATSGVDLDDV